MDVHLCEGGAAILDLLQRHRLQPLEQLGGVFAAMGLHEANDDVGAAPGAPVALLEHGHGLADSGRGAEVDPQESASACHGSSLPVLSHCDAPMVCPVTQGFSASRARLRFRTLTRGSPRNPKVRPFVFWATRAWTCATLRTRR